MASAKVHMAQSRSPFWRRHRWLVIVAGVSLGVLVVVGGILAVLAHRFEPFLRARLVEGLQARFHTRVELDRFHVALGNGLDGEWGIWASGKGLRIWPPQHTGGDRPLEIAVQSTPLISLDEFRFHVPVHFQQNGPIKIGRLRLSGLKIVVPPRSERDKATGIESAVTRQKPSPSGPGRRQSKNPPPREAPPNGTPSNGPQTNTGPQIDQANGVGTLSNVVIERVDCDHAQLILETNKPDKLPLGFDIAHLELTGLSAHGSMGFKAELTNPKPKGVIHTEGRLGPWQTLDPGETPVNGAYDFDHADLATFKNIAGILSSTGNYAGTLRDIVVDGKVDVPDFRLPHFGNAEALHTQFHAKVDGTNGDTWLDPVVATLGHSHFTTRGKVVRVNQPAPDGNQPSTSGPVTSANLPPLADYGHAIDLKVDIDRGRIEDFLHLANRSQTPFITGALIAAATLHIPSGTEPVHERMRLDGTFKLDQAHFTDQKTQDRILELSLRGQGHPGAIKNGDPNSVTSEMQGDFHMANAVITLPDIQYNIPGADIRLSGHYALEGFMNFEGTARMQATVSQMVGGWKGFLLKPADRLFKKNGAGTEVPIEIRGPHDQPQFSIDFGHMKHTSPETPGQKQ